MSELYDIFLGREEDLSYGLKDCGTIYKWRPIPGRWRQGNPPKQPKKVRGVGAHFNKIQKCSRLLALK